jgi:hypothetical protein
VKITARSPAEGAKQPKRIVQGEMGTIRIWLIAIRGTARVQSIRKRGQCVGALQQRTEYARLLANALCIPGASGLAPNEAP